MVTETKEQGSLYSRLARSLWGMIWFFVLSAVLADSDAVAQNACDTDGVTEVRINYHLGHGLEQADADRFLRKMQECTKSVRKSGEIGTTVVDGAPAVVADFYDVVKITYSGPSPGALCSGVIISPGFVLTAAHCACGSNYRVFMQQKPEIENGRVRLLDIQAEQGPILFPGYSCNLPIERQPGRDLALIRFYGLQFVEDGEIREARVPGEEAGTFSFNVRFEFPVLGPALSILKDPKLRNLLVAGYGLTETGERTEVLRMAYIGFKSRFCQFGVIGLSLCSKFAEFSLSRGAASKTGLSPDSCGGDSGGPVFRMDDKSVHPILTEDNKVPSKTLVGIVSRALEGISHPYPGFCGGGGIYTSVGRPDVYKWLDANEVAYRTSRANEEVEDD